MDEALVEAFSATSRDEKLKAYENLQSVINDDLPYVSLFLKTCVASR